MNKESVEADYGPDPVRWEDEPVGERQEEEDMTCRELRPGPELLDDSKIDKCRLVAFAYDHLFDPVGEEMIEAFRTYFKRPGAKLHVMKQGEPMPNADDVGLDYIIHIIDDQTQFSICGVAVSISVSGRIIS